MADTTKELLVKAEDLADLVSKKSKRVLPHVARFCLITTFLEDGLRMCFFWSRQRDYVDHIWDCGYFLASLFVMTSLVGQLVGCIMVLRRFQVNIACGILLFVVFLQMFVYNIVWRFGFFMRHLALVGGLLMVLAESRMESTCILTGLPLSADAKQKTYLQLAGRILIVILFASLMQVEMPFVQIVPNILASVLMVLVAIGFKTKLCALLLVVWLNVINFYFNNWWMHEVHTAYHDFLKFEFFQHLSVIGGLLMVVYLGPGGISIDEKKKN